MPELMPTIFFGHGNPMHAVSNNGYTDGWTAIGASLPRPRAILAVSAHWYIPGCAVTAQAAPPTIHDCGGFPRELYEMTYPAPGSPDLARRVQDLLAPLKERAAEIAKDAEKMLLQRGQAEADSMREILTRRFRRGLDEVEAIKARQLDHTGGKFSVFPDLIVMDGGRGQVNIALVEQLSAQGRMQPAGLAAYARRRPDKSGIYA